jgi:hypothetical protein
MRESLAYSEDPSQRTALVRIFRGMGSLKIAYVSWPGRK